MCWPVDRPANRSRRWSGSTRGLGGGWGILLRLDWELLRGHVLAAGAASHACRRGSGSTRGLGGVGGFFCGWTGSCCGGMCWPRERPATHAAAGAAARGVLVFGLGDSFTRSELGNDTGLMGALLPFVLRVVAGACVGRWTGQPTAAAGGAAARGVRGGLDWDCGGMFCSGFWFGGFFGSLRNGLGGCACVGRGSGQPRMPPRERQHEEFWFFVWGILWPHTCRGSGSTRSGEFFHTHGSGRHEG